MDLHCKGYHFGSFRLTLGLDNLLLTLLLGSFHNECCSLCFLLCNLSICMYEQLTISIKACETYVNSQALNTNLSNLW